MKLVEFIKKEYCHNLMRGQSGLEDILTEENINELISQSYQELIDTKETSLPFAKCVIEIALTYGKAQFNEGVEAARTAIVDDHSVPPQFVP